MFCEVARWQREEGGGKKKTVPQERKKILKFLLLFPVPANSCTYLSLLCEYSRLVEGRQDGWICFGVLEVVGIYPKKIVTKRRKGRRFGW
jgi:hypothetical protein